MKPLKSELKQLEQRREATIELLNQLLEELEGAPVQRRRHSWHPLDLLESAVTSWYRLWKGPSSRWWWSCSIRLTAAAAARP